MPDIQAIFERKKNLFLISAFVLLICVVLGNALVYLNYNAILLVVGTFIFLFIVVRLKVFPITVILLLVPFINWAKEHGNFPIQAVWLPELLSGMLFLKAIVKRILSKEKVNLFGLPAVAGFFFIVYLSYVFNGTIPISVLLFLRLIFRYYLLFLAIINLELDDRSLKQINKVMIFVFLLQLPLSILKLFVYGQGERSLGLSSHSVTTIFPLIAIGFLISYYFLYERSKKYIFLIFFFVGFSIIGGKRAFIFYLPLMLLILAWFLRDKSKIVFRYIFVGIFIFTISAYASFKLLPTLNPEREHGGTFNPIHAIHYAYDYTTSYSRSGYSMGRVSSTITILKGLYNKGAINFLIGLGPGSLLKSMYEDLNQRGQAISEFGVLYGDNGLSWLGLQVGYLGAFVFFILLYLIFKASMILYKIEKDPYWHAFGLGMTAFSLIMLISSVSYTPFFIHDAISAFYFCLAGIVVTKNYRSKESKSA